MSSVKNFLDGVKSIGIYCKDNNAQLSNSAKEILGNSAMSLLLAKVGLMNMGTALRTIKQHWDDFDNEFVHLMGYEPLTHYSLFRQGDDIGDFISNNFSDYEVHEFLALLDNEIQNPTTGLTEDSDLDVLLLDLIIPWFLEKMSHNDPIEGTGVQSVSDDDGVSVFLIHLSE